MQFDNWSSPPSHQVISPYASPVPRNGQKRVLKLCQLDQVWSITANRRLSYSNKIKKMWFPPPLSDRSLFNWGQHKKTAKLAILRCLKFDLNLVFNPRNHDLWPLDLIPLVAHPRSRGYLCTNFWPQGYCGSWDTPNLARFWQFYSNGHLVQVWPISTMSPRHYILEKIHFRAKSRFDRYIKVKGHNESQSHRTDADYTSGHLSQV